MSLSGWAMILSGQILIPVASKRYAFIRAVQADRIVCSNTAKAAWSTAVSSRVGAAAIGAAEDGTAAGAAGMATAMATPGSIKFSKPGTALGHGMSMSRI